MKSKRSFVIAIVVAAIASFSGWMILSQKTPAPDVTVATLSGKPLSLKQLHGKVVLVNFWATTCTTCVSEMPKLVATHNTFASRGYETVAIAMEDDRPDWVLNFAQQRALPFTVALDIKGDAALSFGGVRMTPTSFLIDKQGRIVQRILGEPEWPKLTDKIDQLLKAST